MQPNEALVHRCLSTAELERLQGNEYIADLLNDCANALCESNT